MKLKLLILLVGIQYIRKIHYFGRAIQDARYALVNVGGKMIHVGDLMRYANVLHKKYGLEDPKAHIIENPMIIPEAYIPRDAKHMKYIDCLRHSGAGFFESEDSTQSVPHSCCDESSRSSRITKDISSCGGHSSAKTPT